MSATLQVKTPDDLKDLIQQRFSDEPGWLTRRRQDLSESYFGLPLPERQRTPLKHRQLQKIPVFLAPAESPWQAPVPSRENAGAATLIIQDGRQSRLGSPPVLLDQGVILCTLSEAARETPQLVEQYLGTVVDDRLDKFQALNGAFWQDGLFLYVPPRTEVALPITVTHYMTDGIRGLFPRSLIIVDQQSRVTVTERYLSSPMSERSLFSAATEIIALDGASVAYGAIQQLAPAVDAFIRRGGKPARDARINWHIGEFGAGLLVSGHKTILGEPGGQTESITVFFGADSQHHDYTAESLHIAPHTTSNMIARGVMKDKARSVFTGVTDIRPGAKGTDGRQKEQTLMLSDDARADAIPSLLIEERDVYAAHAASSGPVDKLAIFYLMSRGISEEEAVSLIVQGFLAPVIDAIPVSDLRQQVWDAVERKIRS